jgi:hypothetical protein
MILQDVWELMCEILRADYNTEIDKKMLALNQGYLYLAKLMIENGTYLQELVSDPTDIAITDGVNKISLPSDFLSLMFLWYLSGTTYVPVIDSMLVDYSSLLKQSNYFLDTTTTGVPSLFSINEPYIFTDIRWSETDADGVKVIYHKKPVELVAYDEIELDPIAITLTIGHIVEGGLLVLDVETGYIGKTIRVFDANGVEYFDYNDPEAPLIVNASNEVNIYSATIETFSGTTDPAFVVGEIIIQNTTYASGTIYSIDGTSITVLTNSRNGVFYDSYDIVGQTSGVTTSQTGSMVEKSQELEINEKMKLELATAGALQYLYMEDNPEAEIKLKTLMNLVKKNNVISKSKKDYIIRIN